MFYYEGGATMGDLIKQYEVSVIYMTFWDMTLYNDTLHWSGISLNLDFVTALDLISDVDLTSKFREISIEHVQRLRLGNRGR